MMSTCALESSSSTTITTTIIMMIAQNFCFGIFRCSLLTHGGMCRFFSGHSNQTCGTDKQLAHFFYPSQAVHTHTLAYIRIALSISLSVAGSFFLPSFSLSFTILFYLFVVLFNLSLSAHISNNSHSFIHWIVKCTRTRKQNTISNTSSLSLSEFNICISLHTADTL